MSEERTKPEAGKAPACECPTRKALAAFMAVLPAINSEFWAVYYREAKSALSAPCPCVERKVLTEQIARLIAEGEELQSDLQRVMVECDSLRAEIADANYVKQKALEYGVRLEPEVEALRARVETLEAALRDIRDMDTVQQGRTVSDLDLLYQAKGRAAAALKEGQVV